MKSFCDSNIQKQFIASSKPIDEIYTVSIDSNNVRFIKIEYPTDIIKNAFDNIKLELEIRDGDYQGTITDVYNITSGPAKGHYMFYTYEYGSCTFCDPYSGMIDELYFIPDDKVDEAISKCKKFISNIINSVKLVEKDKIKEFVNYNYAYHWEYNDESKMLDLLRHFKIDLPIIKN
jgi:hypothetical protein